MRTAFASVVAIGLVACGSLLAQDKPPEIAGKAHEVLMKHCTKCHGTVNPQSGMSMLDYGYLVSRGPVTPRQLDKSELWTRVSSTDETLVMPPTGAIPAEDQAILKEWIEAGAPAFPAEAPPPRVKIGIPDIYQAVDRDVRKYPPEERAYLRYFSLAHLHNHPAVSERDLRMYRAAVAKLCNSLSWEARIYHPEPIDEYATILRVNLVDLGWFKTGLWKKLLAYYPYGIRYDDASDPALRIAATDVYQATGTVIPIVRGDWFVVAAAQPPLYEDMLMLPTGERADWHLEQKLQVDTFRDFLTHREVRAGILTSKITDSNHIDARHPSPYGAYWKSYYFRSNLDKQNILQYPLGPIHAENEYGGYAFRHYGCGIMFHLPNGLQGYLLTDGYGNYRPTGPPDVLYASRGPHHVSVLTNGISCISCHEHGTIVGEPDAVRRGHALQGPSKVKAERLYVAHEEFTKYLDEDRQRYLRAYADCCAGYLCVGEHKARPIEKFAEPIGSVARHYLYDLSLADVLAETGYGSGYGVAALCEQDDIRRVVGMSPLSPGKLIQRRSWEYQYGGYSVYQHVVSGLRMGTPVWLRH